MPASRPSLVILTAGEGWHACDLLRAAKDEGVAARLERFDLLRASAGHGSPRAALEGDAIIVRTMPRGSLEQVIFRMDALHAAVLAGIEVINSPRALETAIDKYLSLVRLGEAGLPIPETRVDQTLTDALSSYEALGGDVVLKPLFGSEGRGLERLQTPHDARISFERVLAETGLVYQQVFVDHPGEDLRAFVLDGEVIAAMSRRSTSGFITNVAQGGVPAHVTLDPKTRDLAVRGAAAVGARVAGVDILPARDGRVFVLEVNAVPGWRALARVSGVDCARAIVRSAVRREARAESSSPLLSLPNAVGSGELP